MVHGSGRLRVAASAVACSIVAGCTFLAVFEDRPTACDGGGCLDGDADAEADATALDAGADAAVEASARDAAADARDAASAPCKGLPSGTYCANDGLHAYPGPASDLVVCDGGAVASARACDAGCLALQNPFPDACNPCPEKANGAYCGRDFPGFPAENADYFLQCQQGNAVQIVACAHGCTSNGASSSCAP